MQNALCLGVAGTLGGFSPLFSGGLQFDSLGALFATPTPTPQVRSVLLSETMENPMTQSMDMTMSGTPAL